MLSKSRLFELSVKSVERVNSPTFSTVPPFSVAFSLRVFFVVRVSLWAVGFLGVFSTRPGAPKRINPVNNSLQVRGVGTPSVSAQMVKLKTGQTEVSFFKRDEETSLMLKCRCDLVANTADGSTWIFDPKKVQTGEATKEAFEKQAWNLGYMVQHASYLSITGASRFIFVPFDDDTPFDACQWEPDADLFRRGYEEWRRLLLAYSKCVKENYWPGYHQNINKMEAPSFVKRRDV